MKVRTRFAPSPTGFMHIGGVRTALFEYLVAKKNNGSFILRIEDTDQERFVEGATDVIYSTLKDLGLNWDEGPDIGGNYGPYVQSERKGNYLKYAQKLVEEGKAYYCFCDEERLEELKHECELSKIPYKYDGRCRGISLEEAKKKIENGEKYVIRFKTPNDGVTTFTDEVYGNVSVNNDEIEDLIMIKSDLMPTYNFANIVDDHEMEITHVIRGNEYISSTPKYVLMYEALGWIPPKFIHLPVIKKNKDSDKKLSKRDGDATVDALKSKGYLGVSILNMLALTGWSPKGERELYTLEELLEVFDVSGISKSNAIFDVDKLNWINAHYIKQLNIEELLNITVPHLKEHYDLNGREEWVKELVSLYQNTLSYGSEIVELTKMFFDENIEMNEESVEFMRQDGIDNTLNIFKTEIQNISDWTVENITNAINNTKELSGAKGKMLYMPIRIKTTGLMHGPELPNTLHLLGKDKVLSRLNK